MGFWDRLKGTPTPADFADMVLKRLKKAGSAEVQFDEEAFALRFGPARATTYLHNFYDEYRAAPRGAREQVVQRLVKHALSDPEANTAADSGEFLARALPRVRERLFYELIPLDLENDGHDVESFYFKPLAEHLAVGLVEDLPDRIIETAVSKLKSIGIDPEEASRVALTNLKRMSEQPFEMIGPGLFVSPWHDNHDTARLLLVEKIRRLNVRGDPVVAVPNRDVLLIAGTDDPVALAKMAAIIDDLTTKPRFMTSIPVCLVGDGWAPFVPEAEHPAYAPFTELRLKQLVREYERQKDALNKKQQRAGVDVFVASFKAMKTEDGAFFSWCSWAKDVPSLLPRTDRIAFVDVESGSEPIAVEWHRAADVLGERLQPLEMFPPRYRVEGFPSPAELDRMS